MARQEGIVPFTGKLGGLSFYYDKRTGYQVRTKGGFSGRRIKTEDRYTRTRENSIEFACAVRSAKVLRTLLHELLHSTADRQIVNRLNAQMIRVVKGDTFHDRGKRNVSHGASELLNGFEFNMQTSFIRAFGAPILISRENTLVRLAFGLVSPKLVKHPQGATHFRIASQVALVNFTTLVGRWRKAGAEMISLATLPVVPVMQVHHLECGVATHIVVALNIEFFQQTNGVMFPLSDRSYNAGMISEVYSLI